MSRTYEQGASFMPAALSASIVWRMKWRTDMCLNRSLYFLQPKNKDPYTRHTLFNTNAADIESAIVQNGGSGGREAETPLCDISCQYRVTHQNGKTFR